MFNVALQELSPRTYSFGERYGLLSSFFACQWWFSRSQQKLIVPGIDVQAELGQKNGSPNLQTNKPTGGGQANGPSPATRKAPNRQPSRRNKPGLLPKVDPTGTRQPHREDTYTMRSPQLQPTPSSHVSSPTAKSPGFIIQSGSSPVGIDMHVQQQQQQNNAQSRQRSSILPQPGPFAQNHSMTAPPVGPMEPVVTSQPLMPSANVLDSGRMASAFYPSPFQKHYDQLGKTMQLGVVSIFMFFMFYFFIFYWYFVYSTNTVVLEQEYDAHADMVDEAEHDDTTEGTHYASNYHDSATRRDEHRDDHGIGHTHHNHHQGESEGFGSTNSLFDHFDPMLDADPFGLTASMHFQTPFSYSQSHNRP